MGMTYVQKLLARACGKPVVAVGDVLEPPVHLAMSHENGALVINQFNEIFQGTGREPKVWDPSRIAIIFDHRVPAESSKTATNQKKIREFIAQQGIRKFHDIRGDVGGICHQILPENGYVRPGFVLVGTDSHTTTHGALGAFAFGIGATEMAAVWALGRILNVEVPGTIKVVVNGRFAPGVYAKDLILHLIGKLTAEGANYKVIEFHGEAIKDLPTSGRLVLCNMTVEAGATAGVVPPDAETERYLRDEAGVKEALDLFGPDRDAVYDRVVEIDAAVLGPQIACPHAVDNVKPIGEVVGKKVHQIVVGSCTNGHSTTSRWRRRFSRASAWRTAPACWCSRPRGASTPRRCAWATCATSSRPARWCAIPAVARAWACTRGRWPTARRRSPRRTATSRDGWATRMPRSTCARPRSPPPARSPA